MKAVIFLTATLVVSEAALAVPPTIFVAWGETPGPQPIQDYLIDTTDPDFPEIELITGSLTWKVWSTDTDNTDGLGDIGEIRCPYAQNFAVKIRDDSQPNLFGARNIKAIRLVPSSTSNYANITEARFASLTDELVVAATGSGTGGEAWLHVSPGPVLANMTIHKAHRILISGAASGTIAIDELVDECTIGTWSGNLTVATATSTDSSYAFFRIFSPLSGTITVSEIENDTFYVFFPGGIAESGVLTLGAYLNENEPSELVPAFEFGGNPLDGYKIDGTINFLDGVHWDVKIFSELRSTGVIDLNGTDVIGSLELRAGGSGSIVNGGSVTGDVMLGSVHSSQPYPFTGTASFGNVSSTGSIVASAGSMTGTIQITGTTPMGGDIVIGDSTNSVNIGSGGFINVTPSLASGADVTVFGDVLPGGRIRLTNEMLSGSELDINGNVDSGGLVQLEKGLASGGSADISGNLAGTLEIGTSSGFGGTVSGLVQVDGNLSGTISHYGLTTATGVFELGPMVSGSKYNQTLTNPTSPWEGSLTVNGDMAGTLSFQTKLDEADVTVEGAMSGTININEMYDSSLALNTVNYCSNSTSGTITVGAKQTVWSPNSGTNIVDLNQITIWGSFTSSARLKFVIWQWTSPINFLSTVCYKRGNSGQEQVLVPSGTSPPSVIHCPATTDPCCSGC